jgi:hypothetical protein
MKEKTVSSNVLEKQEVIRDWFKEQRNESIKKSDIVNESKKVDLDARNKLFWW